MRRRVWAEGDAGAGLHRGYIVKENSFSCPQTGQRPRYQLGDAAMA